MKKALARPFFQDAAILCLFALVPLLWFRAPGFIISGDMLPPITFENFINRFFSWDERFGAGVEGLLHYSVLFFYSIETFFNSIMPTIELAQKAEFVFWFLLPGVSIYYLLGVVLQGEGKRWGRLVGVSFYMFNLYLEPVWQGLNIANLSSYVFVPIMLGLVIEGLERRRSFWFCVLSVSLITFFAAPIGSNPPMLAASLLPFVFVILFYLLRHRVWGNLSELFRIFSFFFCILFFSILINLFWIIPFVDRVFINPASTSLEFTSGSALEWLKGLSKNTSLFNVARMQGAWVWYEGFGEPYAPYAAIYKHNPLYILLGFFLPILAALGFIMGKKNSAAPLFGLFAVIGIVLGTGIHPPFGKLYAWMVENVPFFYTIRSPWYKFTLLTCLGYAGLLALLGQFVSAKSLGFLKERKTIHAVLGGGVVFLLMASQWVYAFPVSMGRQFFTPSEREFMTHNFMSVPQYVYEARDYLSKQKGDFRLLDASSKNLQEYNWGNFGFNHPLTNFSTLPVFYHSMKNSSSLAPSDQIVKIFHQMIEDNEVEPYVQMLHLFNIRYVLYPSDLHWYHTKEIKQAAKVREFLDKNPGLAFEKRFGFWDLYRVKEKPRPLIEVNQEPLFVIGNLKHLPALSSLREPLLFVDSLKQCLGFPIEKQKRLLLLNMDLEELAISECSSQFNQGTLNNKKQQIVFNQDKTEVVEIWLKATGKDLSQIANMQLDDKSLSLAKERGGFFPQWGQVYEGELSQGEHVLYVRGGSKEAQINQVVVVPKEEKQAKSSWIEKLIEDKKIVFEAVTVSSIKDDKKKEEAIIWTSDLSVPSEANITVSQKHPGFSFYRGKKGLVLKFSEKIPSADPSVVLSVSGFKPISLSEYPDFYFEYDLHDPLSTSAQVRFLFEEASYKKPSSFELLLPASPYIPLEQEVMRRYPDKQKAHLVEMEVIFAHSFIQRKGYRRYPKTDVEIQKWSLAKSTDSEKDPVILSKNIESKEVRFKKKSPVHYKVQLDPSEGSQLLILNQAYHPGWSAQDAKGELLAHYEVNGWANGFVIAPKNKGEITLYFSEQKRVNRGFFVSGGSFAFLLLSFGILTWRQRGRK